MSEKLDVVGIGNAIVDILSHVDDHVVENLGLKKGTTALIDENQAEKLYTSLNAKRECSGGSAANTIAGIASLGGKCGFIGKVKNDMLGEAFSGDLNRLGVEFPTEASNSGASTARCLVFVTPDGERTMATYLGACVKLTVKDIDETLIKRAKILYIEGYLWDEKAAIEAIEKAIKCARENGVKTAFTLSDTFCVARHREAFKKLVATVDIIFANEAEICSLYETSYLEEGIAELKKIVKLAAVTQSADGVTIIENGAIETIAATKVAKAVDTTGAGDLFAAGFLYGLLRNYSNIESANIGHIVAGHIIQQLGPRTTVPLKSLFDDLAA